MFPAFTEDDIDSYKATYRGSAEEERDLLELYQRFHGNMDKAQQCSCLGKPAFGKADFKARTCAQKGVQGC